MTPDQVRKAAALLRRYDDLKETAADVARMLGGAVSLQLVDDLSIGVAIPIADEAKKAVRVAAQACVDKAASDIHRELLELGVEIPRGTWPVIPGDGGAPELGQQFAGHGNGGGGGGDLREAVRGFGRPEVVRNGGGEDDR